MLPKLKRFKLEVDASLRKLFAGAIKDAKSIDPGYVELLTVARDQLLRSGKRLRPFITRTTYLGTGGSDADGVMPAAAAMELIHHFLIIHDDVIDRDLVRHGGLNVAGIYHDRFLEQGRTEDEAYHYGASYAILAGDACLSLGLDAILHVSASPERRLAATG